MASSTKTLTEEGHDGGSRWLVQSAQTFTTDESFRQIFSGRTELTVLAKARVDGLGCWPLSCLHTRKEVRGKGH